MRVPQAMQAYCMTREDLDYVLDVTKFKTQAHWNDDPMKNVPTNLKSAFTRCARARALLYASVPARAQSTSGEASSIPQACLHPVRPVLPPPETSVPARTQSTSGEAASFSQ